MTICVDKRIGYAKLETFCFRLGGIVDPEAIIDFGDGSTEGVNGRAIISHQYDQYGTYSACVTTCLEGEIISEECQKITVKPYVEDRIVFDSYPLSGFTTTDDGMNFQVSLSANCPPPIRVKLDLVGTISPPVSELPDTSFQDCLPKHIITANIPFDVDTFIIENPSRIIVNGEVCGWHETFCFGFYDDYPADNIMKLTLERDCKDCFDIDWDVCDPVSSCDIYGQDHLPIRYIDEDLGY